MRRARAALVCFHIRDSFGDEVIKMKHWTLDGIKIIVKAILFLITTNSKKRWN